jgi:hypothetical protein
MDPTLAALLGAVIGGALSVLASWLAQRIQSRSQWLVQEVKQRQQLYSEFVQGSARCFADALQRNELDPGRLAKLFGEIGRMRLFSSEAVIKEAYDVAHKIVETYGDANRSDEEVRDFLAQDSIDLFSAFGDACRAELAGLAPHDAIKLARLQSHPMPEMARGTRV